ncbi:MAG TPA: MFS transporter [Anaeromyxobacteraceae bacterium]|nr:MFS transporter [Anaeromyxobacteraceae bacterium]
MSRTLPLASRMEKLAFPVLVTISACHFLNDMVQSLIAAVYPILKSSLHLDFGELGLITLTYQLTASLLQPLVGLSTDRRPRPFSLATGMGFTLLGLLLLSVAPRFSILLLAAAVVGLGSSVFHPEASRVVRIASGGHYGLAQSVFQVGGNAGSALGPLLAALIVLPRGRQSIAGFSLAALLAILLLLRVGAWYGRHLAQSRARPKAAGPRQTLPSGKVLLSLAILGALVFSKYFYMASLTNYYTFYLIDKFGLSVRDAQVHLFAFLGAVAVGTVLGGPIGDRIGRKYVMWGSILGVLPFSLLLPYASLRWTGVLSVIIGLVLSSAFSAILVYAQELIPGRVGLISGLFFGFAFGMGGIGAALLGSLADHTSIAFVYRICSFLPAIGILTAFLPDTRRAHLPALKPA